MLPQVEYKYIEQAVYDGFSLSEADTLRRPSPLHRDMFDDFLYVATTPAVGEGQWSRFSTACAMYLSSVGRLDGPPPLIPPDTAATVADVLSRFRPRQPGDKYVERLGRITEHTYMLAEELFHRLGGDLGDGIHAAGLRVYSKMMSARISDGFVHPAIGGQLWADVPAGPPHLPSSGRDITILASIEKLNTSWKSGAPHRADIERQIFDHANVRGWNDQQAQPQAPL